MNGLSRIRSGSGIRKEETVPTRDWSVCIALLPTTFFILVEIKIEACITLKGSLKSKLTLFNMQLAQQIEAQLPPPTEIQFEREILSTLGRDHKGKLRIPPHYLA